MSALVTVPLTTWFLQMSPKPSIFKFHSGNTLGLDVVPEGIVIGGEDRDRAFLREGVFSRPAEMAEPIME